MSYAVWCSTINCKVLLYSSLVLVLIQTFVVLPLQARRCPPPGEGLLGSLHCTPNQLRSQRLSERCEQHSCNAFDTSKRKQSPFRKRDIYNPYPCLRLALHDRCSVALATYCACAEFVERRGISAYKLLGGCRFVHPFWFHTYPDHIVRGRVRGYARLEIKCGFAKELQELKKSTVAR